MTAIIKNLRNGRLARWVLAAATFGVVGLVPSIASARDHEYDRGDRYHETRDWRHDNDHHDHDDVRLDFGVISGAPARYDTQRVWVEPVYRTVCDRVWVPAEYRTVTERVWREPVTKDACDRVWVDAVYENRDRVSFDHHGRRHVDCERVLVSPGHWEERHHTVVVSEGHFEDVTHQELVCDGHWQNVERQEVVAPGHWEERAVARVDDRPHWSIGLEIGGH